MEEGRGGGGGGWGLTILLISTNLLIINKRKAYTITHVGYVKEGDGWRQCDIIPHIQVTYQLHTYPPLPPPPPSTPYASSSTRHIHCILHNFVKLEMWTKHAHSYLMLTSSH